MSDQHPSREDLLGELARLRKQLEASSLHSELAFEHIADATQYIIAVFDEAGTLVLANKAAAKLFGQPLERLPGTPLQELLPKRYEDLAALMKYVFSRGATLNFEDRLTDDDDRLLLSVLEPISLEAGQYVKLTAFDFTERIKTARNVQFERDLFQHFFNHNPSGLLVFDASGKVISLNKRIERLFNAPTKEMIGRRFDDPRWQMRDTDGGDIPPDEMPFTRIKQHGKPIDNEVYIVGNPNGSHRHVLLNATALIASDGNFDGMITSITDITDLVHMRQELQGTQERLGFHMENSPLAVIEWDEDLRVTIYSGRAEAIFGWKAEEVLGLRWDEWNYVHPDDISHVDDLNESLLAVDKPDHFITINRNVRKDDQVIWCQWYVSLRRMPDGRVDSILTFIADITPRVQRERDLRLHEAMLAQAQDIAEMTSFSWDLDTNMITWAEGFREQLDLSNEVSPYMLFPYVYPPDRPLIKAFIGRVLEGEEEDMHLTFRTVQEGKVQHLRARCQRVKGLNDERRVVGYVQNITKTVETERELLRHREYLSELVDARTQELKEANERLKEMARLKDEFVSNVSHELRTPITSLKVRLHTLGRKPEALPDYLPVLQRETNRLQQTIENLLFLSRLDQTAVEVAFQQVDLLPFLRQYIADRQMVAAERDITLRLEETDLNPAVIADPHLLERLLGILLSNALQYTPAEGEVSVCTHMREHDQQQWGGFYVRDTGPGIPPDEHDTIFERFIRGRGAYEMGQPGTGLGLSIAREIVQTHGGTIELESSTTSPTGTTFYVWLPRP